MDIGIRRNLLLTTPNPGVRMDYLVRLDGRVRTQGENTDFTVNLSYVPDRVILDPAAFGRYLDALSQAPWSSLESVAVAILEDVNNEVIARWVQVAAEARDAVRADGGTHTVTLEDRQPHWENKTLLSRL